jgi:hypothetical protein
VLVSIHVSMVGMLTLLIWVVTHVTILAQLATDSLKTLVTLAQKEHT